MLRGDEVEYKSDLSPYGLPHVVEEELVYVSYEDYETGFKPKKTVCIGGTVVLQVDGQTAVGKVNQIKKKGRSKGLYCWLTLADGAAKVTNKRKVTAAPTIHEFVRQTSSQCWFQVKELGNLIAISRVLISPKKKQKTKDTEGLHVGDLILNCLRANYESYEYHL